MTGDASDMARRLRTVLPQGWFGDDTPVLDTLLQGLGAGLSAFYGLLEFVRAQTRIATAVGTFLDGVAADFFGAACVRWTTEPDSAFRVRIQQTLLRPRGTRSALATALTDLTGRAPAIFEPCRPADTGGYAVGGVGYGVAGGWGNLSLPYQVFVTAYRPTGTGIAALAGYGVGGIPVYGSLGMEAMPITDALIQAAIPALLPAGTTAWLRISN